MFKILRRQLNIFFNIHFCGIPLLTKTRGAILEVGEFEQRVNLTVVQYYLPLPFVSQTSCCIKGDFELGVKESSSHLSVVPCALRNN